MFADRQAFLRAPAHEVEATRLGVHGSVGWARLGEAVRLELVAGAAAACETAWTQILASDYRAYVEKGDRASFEALYFERRLKLNHLVLGECAEGKGRFVNAIVDGLWLIAEESGWQLPAHNAYGRGGARLPLPDPDDPVIDLFAAETAASIAVAMSLLRVPLDEVAPGLCRRLEHEIGRRIISPYLARHFWWMGRGDERMNNWTAWITQNVLLVAHLLPIDEALRRTISEKALASLDAFVKDYADDGACEEGVVYYRHAALCLFGAMTVLDEAWPGAMTPLFQHPKIRNMADFIRHMHVAGRYFFNFADAAAVVEPCSAREFLFGKAVGSRALQAFAAADAKGAPACSMPNEWNLWYRLQAVEAVEELRTFGDDAPEKSDWIYPGIGLAIARDDIFSLAVKGGHNGESHNHNDVGSITVYKHGQPVLIDVGVETYTAKTFSPNRYDIWTMQSAYHNLPTFDGIMQRDGETFRATDMTMSGDERQVEIALDIAAAYPPEAGVRRYRRTVRLVRGAFIEVCDRFEGTRPAVLSLMTVALPRINDQTIELGELAEITIAGGGAPVVEPIDITDARLRQSWPERIYRVLVPLAGAELTLTIR